MEEKREQANTFLNNNNNNNNLSTNKKLDSSFWGEQSTENEELLEFKEFKQKISNFLRKIKERNTKEKSKVPEKTGLELKKRENTSNEEKKEEEVLDLVKLKEMFKLKKRTISQKPTSNQKDISGNDLETDDFSFNLKVISLRLKQHARWLVPLLFIFIAIFVSSYLRLMPTYLPLTDDWAKNGVYNFYQQQIETRINQQYPSLPEDTRKVMIEAEMKTYLAENKAQVEKDIFELSQQYKNNFQDENGETYLIEIDPYLWYSQARNLVNYGHPGDKKVGEDSYFSLRDGRLSKYTKFQLHPYVGAYLYKFLNLFTDISLMRTMFLLPVILMSLAVIPIFFLAKKFSGNMGGLVAALFLVLNVPLLGRTPAGFSDTDSYAILFPLIVSWLFMEAYLAKKETTRWLFSLSSGFFVGVYAAAWTGWLSVFLFILGAISLSLVFWLGAKLIKDKNRDWKALLKDNVIKKNLEVLFLFFASSAVFVTLFKDFVIFYSGFIRPFKFINLKEVGVQNIWPNVLTTVAEFNASSLSKIMDQVGGNMFFVISLLGIITLLFTWKKNRILNLLYLLGSGVYYFVLVNQNEWLNKPLFFIVALSIPIIIGIFKTIHYRENIDLVYPLLITLWFIGTAYAFTRGVRFALLIAPAFSLAIGLAVGFIFQKISKGLRISKKIYVSKRIPQALFVVVLFFLLITPYSNAESIAKNEMPMMNDSWHHTLTKIKETSERAIITSWWDFGHWFYTISERMVTFDGGDQGERIYWVGKSLLTSKEQEAIGILRMLNCVQETAPAKLNEFTKDNLKSIQIINEVVLIFDREEARQKYVEFGLTEEQAKVMIEYTHCLDLIDNYFITSEDMVGKSGVWGHFGSWDFVKATMYQTTIKMKTKEEAIKNLTENFGLSVEKANKIYEEIKKTPGDHWIAPWPGYLSPIRSCENLEGNKLRCTSSIQGGGKLEMLVEMQNLNVTLLNNPEFQPNSLVYVTKDDVIEKKMAGKQIGVSLVLIPEGNHFNFLLTDPLQDAGMFTRLFFLEGHGLKCFQKFEDVQQLYGGRIITWKIDFNCNQENKYYS